MLLCSEKTLVFLADIDEILFMVPGRPAVLRLRQGRRHGPRRRGGEPHQGPGCKSVAIARVVVSLTNVHHRNKRMWCIANTLGGIFYQKSYVRVHWSVVIRWALRAAVIHADVRIT